jgi:type I restriction enzyme R subunit
MSMDCQMDDTSHNESYTRQHIIDQQLACAGWSAANRTLIEELPLAHNTPKLGEQRESYRTASEYADYALLGRDGAPLAIVEAKRGSRDALGGAAPRTAPRR